MLALASFLAAAALAAAAPATTFDQRQDGDFNVRADVQNVVFVVAVPEKLAIPSSLYGLFKNAKHNHDSEIQDRADVHVMEAFVEPSEPYHVEIGESSRRADGGDGRTVEVVIAGRRRLGGEQLEAEAPVDAQPQPAAAEENEFKLIGATEQCGPDAERDPDTLMCRVRSTPVDQPEEHLQTVTVQHATPEVVPASS